MASTPEASIGQLGLALATVGGVVHRVTSDQWASPTPCTDWPVRAVVNHLVGMNLVFSALVGGEPMPTRVELADEDLAARYDSSAELLLAAFSAPGALDGDIAGPLGSASGEERLQIRLYDLIAHGWDVARATGQSLNLPEELVEHSLAFSSVQLHGVDRSGRFAPARSVPDSAEAIDRLVSFLGRDVNWSAPAER
ncbi:MAG: TIGR03086 family protein [Actinomycetales bacterium]|nr:TIGR03086 family protein [Actinomycetales bacterium]